MPFSRGTSRRELDSLGLSRCPRRRRLRLAVLAALPALALVFACGVSLYLRSLSSGTALSDARDSVTAGINRAVNRVIREGNYGYGAFVALEKDSQGGITAVTTDTARVNLFASEVLQEITGEAADGMFDVRIPLGSLLGSNLLLGRGPEVPVRISMLTSPSVRFENSLTAAGINQSRHTLTLLCRVDIDILIPWGCLSDTVETEVLIAETVLLGRVPETYLNWENESHGYQGSERGDRAPAP
ncbi:MAG: sporulation protein YunB [Oscillospiraceae bacterium]|nr:sporulation protein YunB [Oscillospiraceae bacterium]